MQCCISNKQNMQYRNQGWKQQQPHLPSISLNYLGNLFFLFLHLWALQVSNCTSGSCRFQSPIFQKGNTFSRRKTRDLMNYKLQCSFNTSGFLCQQTRRQDKNCSLGRKVGTLLNTIGWEEYVLAPSGFIQMHSGMPQLTCYGKLQEK